MKTQKQRIREYLLKGKSLTQLKALFLFRCLRLSARIKNLRQSGLKIKTTMVTSHGIFGRKRYGVYTIEK